MADYGKYALTAPFAALLDEFVIEDGENGSLFITHRECTQVVCEVEEADHVSTLLRTVIGHDCET